MRSEPERRARLMLASNRALLPGPNGAHSCERDDEDIPNELALPRWKHLSLSERDCFRAINENKWKQTKTMAEIAPLVNTDIEHTQCRSIRAMIASGSLSVPGWLSRLPGCCNGASSNTAEVSAPSKSTHNVELSAAYYGTQGAIPNTFSIPMSQVLNWLDGHWWQHQTCWQPPSWSGNVLLEDCLPIARYPIG